MTWADEQRKLLVRTNADQPDQAANAIAFGAQGIGLCRTEHMFFGGDRIVAMREMILAESQDERGRRPWPSCCPSSATTSPASSASWATAR